MSDESKKNKKFLVEAVSQYRMVYCVEADSAEEAREKLEKSNAGSNPIEELGQSWLGEIALSAREVDDDEIVRVFDEINDYLVEWTREEKLARCSSC